MFLRLGCGKVNVLSTIWAHGSVVERFPDKKEVLGSIPSAPTMLSVGVAHSSSKIFDVGGQFSAHG